MTDDAAGRGMPSAEAMDFLQEHGAWIGLKRVIGVGRLLDAYAARRVEHAVAQERERHLKIMHAYGLEYTLPGEGAIEDVISGITTRGSGSVIRALPDNPPLTTPPAQTE
jgi:hypothetical protein